MKSLLLAVSFESCRSRWTWVYVLCVLTLGCWDSGGPRRVPVNGTVEYNGNPLTSGSAVFVPVDSNTGHSARGMINSDGGFELTTFDDGDGAVPGEYKVTVFSYDGMRDVPGSPFQAVGPSLIPERYNDANTTDLQQTVGEKRMTVKLELKD